MSSQDWSNDPISTQAKLRQQLQPLDTLIDQLFVRCRPSFDIIVLTNATKGWVLYSCQQLLDQAYTWIQQCCIISARDRTNDRFQESKFWKLWVVNYQLCRQFDIYDRIIGIGDSWDERHALQTYASSRSDCVVSTLRVFSSSLDQLIQNLSLCVDLVINLNSKVSHRLDIEGHCK